MRLSRQFQVCFFFFKEKILDGKKVSHVKTNNFTTFVTFCAQKTVAFVVVFSLTFVLLVAFCMFYIFLCCNIFPIKKINKQKVVSITSFTILLTRTTFMITCKNIFFIYDHL